MEMPSGAFSAIIQVVLAIIASGVFVKVLTLRQDRRKIAGDASASEANAASTLSGAALQMVEASQRSARDADSRATAANDTANEARRENERLWKELNKTRWEVHWERTQREVVEAALRRAGISVPPAPKPENGFPDFPPPEAPHLPPLPPSLKQGGDEDQGTL